MMKIIRRSVLTTLKALKNRQFWRVGLVGFMIAQVLFGYLGSANLVQAGATDVLDTTKTASTIPVYSGVDQSIADYLCVPNDSNVGTALFDCIQKAYRFGVAFGAIALVFFFVLAGYAYMTGGETGKEKGKGIFLAALTGMAIILSSYVLLKFINPNLVKIKPLQPPIFTAAALPKCEDVLFKEACITSSGQVHQTSGSGVAGSASEAQYKDLITKYASPNGLDYCGLSALIQKESSFRRLVSSHPETIVNESSGPPSYNLSFNVFHAIGLTQITIYPKSSGGWVGDTPARSAPTNFGKSPLTFQMLLDPETNISAGAKYFGRLYAKNKQNLRSTYDDFQSGEGDTRPGDDSDPATLNLFMDMYSACLKRGK